MALKAGRVGVLPSEVDTNGKIKKDGGDIEKVKEQISTFSFRDNEGQPQYKATEDGEWVNFSSGGGGAELLWTNPSPAEVFRPQTVSLDLSGYSHIMLVLIAESSRSDGIANLLIPVNTPTTFYFSAGTHNDSNSRAGIRELAVNENGVVFGNGGYLNTYYKQYNYSNDSYGKPIRIYGINLEL